MTFCDTNTSAADRADTVSAVLRCLTELLCHLPPKEDLSLSDSANNGLTTILLTCAETLEKA